MFDDDDDFLFNVLIIFCEFKFESDLDDAFEPKFKFEIEFKELDDKFDRFGLKCVLLKIAPPKSDLVRNISTFLILKIKAISVRLNQDHSFGTNLFDIEPKTWQRR